MQKNPFYETNPKVNHNWANNEIYSKMHYENAKNVSHFYDNSLKIAINHFHKLPKKKPQKVRIWHICANLRKLRYL